MSALFIYKFIFMTELLSAELMVSFRMQKRRYFVLRLITSLILLYLLAYLFPLLDDDVYTGWYSCLMFLTFFALTILMLKFIYVISWNNVLFIAIVAYTIKHFCYAIFRLILVLTNLDNIINIYSAAQLDFAGLDNSIIFYMLIYLSSYIFFYAVLYFIIGYKVNRQESYKLKTAHLLFVSAFAIIVDIVLNSFVVYSGSDVTYTSSIINCCFNIMCCLLVFYVQLNLMQIKEVQGENKIISQLLHAAQSQYQFHKENIELINIKCHDIRHQIHGYLSESNIDSTEIEKINEAISIYGTLIKTGNEALDIVLTEKSLICKNKEIVLTCMVDCKDLSFIKDSDIYALFGNLMDNAIDAVSKISEKEKRCISLNIHTVNKFITITVKNYYSDKIVFSHDGLPITTKGDNDFHGFGLKSIKLIVEKYKGNLSLVTENDVFKVNIFFTI